MTTVVDSVEDSLKENLHEIRKIMPQYFQSFNYLQDKYLNTLITFWNSSICLGKQTPKQVGTNTEIPNITNKHLDDANNKIVNFSAIPRHFNIVALDVANQNLKIFNNSVKAFAEINKIIIESWFNAFTKVHK